MIPHDFLQNFANYGCYADRPIVSSLCFTLLLVYSTHFGLLPVFLSTCQTTKYIRMISELVNFWSE